MHPKLENEVTRNLYLIWNDDVFDDICRECPAREECEVDNEQRSKGNHSGACG